MATEQELRQEIVSVVDELFAMGMITPTGGNISVRIPDEEDAFLITPTMLYKGGAQTRGHGEGEQQRPSLRTPPAAFG